MLQGQKILLSKLFSSHGLAHSAEGKDWAQIRASAGHNLCLANLAKRDDSAFSSKFSQTLVTH